MRAPRRGALTTRPGARARSPPSDAPFPVLLSHPRERLGRASITRPRCRDARRALRSPPGRSAPVCTAAPRSRSAAGNISGEAPRSRSAAGNIAGEASRGRGGAGNDAGKAPRRPDLAGNNVDEETGAPGSAGNPNIERPRSGVCRRERGRRGSPALGLRRARRAAASDGATERAARVPALDGCVPGKRAGEIRHPGPVPETFPAWSSHRAAVR
jgi:hypothetical protein